MAWLETEDDNSILTNFTKKTYVQGILKSLVSIVYNQSTICKCETYK